MPDHGIGSWPERPARITGPAAALRQAGRVLSYADLAAGVETLARTLAGHGVGHGTASPTSASTTSPGSRSSSRPGGSARCSSR